MSSERLALRAAAAGSLALAPLLLAQGLLVRRRTPRLPDAAGPPEGLADGPGPALRLLVVGESTVAGVGAATCAEALAGQFAAALAARLGRAVAWRAAGQSGATAAELRGRIVPGLPAEPADLALVALGVNDTLRFHGPRRWAADLADLVAALRARVGPAPLALAAVPPMGRFPALPQPLRATLGARARLLDLAAADLAATLPDVAHLPISIPVTPELFCADGFHPGPAGYRRWGELLAYSDRLAWR